VNAELGVDVLKVLANRRRSDRECGREVFVSAAFGEEVEDLAFAAGERRGLFAEE
jgi:hypothetical protein